MVGKQTSLFAAGLTETAIHFVIYEHIKKMVKSHNQKLELKDCMLAAGIAKFTASSVCYPHGEHASTLHGYPY